MFRAEPNSRTVYFLTNAHLIQDRALAEKHIQLEGAAAHTLGARLPIKVVGRAPGYDLAVLRVEASSLFSDAEWSEILKNLPTPISAPIAGARYYHAGVPSNDDYLSGSLNLTHTWENMLKRFSSSGQTELFPTLANVNGESKLWTSDDCQQPFLKNCYVSNVPSWGFSGGAHMAETVVDGKKVARIVGIITNFQYLAERTVVIPMDLAMEVGNEIIRIDGDLLQDRAENPRYLLTDQKTFAVTFLAGPLNGKNFVQSAGSLAQGGAGGDLAGGGAGGDLAGGGAGGDLAGGGLKFNQARATEKNFMVRGMRALIEYKPGVIAGGVRYRSAWVKGKRIEINKLQDLIVAYEQDPKLKLSTSAVPSRTFGPLFSQKTLGFLSGQFPLPHSHFEVSLLQDAKWDLNRLQLSATVIKPGKPGEGVIYIHEKKDFESVSQACGEYQLGAVYRVSAEKTIKGQAMARVDYDPILNRTLVRFVFRSDGKFPDGSHYNETLVMLMEP